MFLTRMILPVVAASFLATMSFAAGDQPAPAQGPCPAYGAGFGGGPMGFLTPEERMMHFADVQKAAAGMSVDQMRAYRMAERNKVMGMSPAERQKFASDLKAKWDALSADQKSQLQQQMASFRANRPMMGGRGMGHGGRGRGGCP
ncbi:MAG: hypothetical protein KGI68_04300 [Alphaproteobacteria bacterium]|nr:hypothetical protein [Alphaproteobacteria bacterium]MDE2164453.1 hypothetical protein [Alphaproteobacteria bacterium]MDE2265346.1 hypothetical protein [Alphaproteobacteria bacterium]